MNASPISCRGLTVAFCLLFPALATAAEPSLTPDQQVRTRKLIIQNGPYTTVHYNTSDLPPDQAALYRRLAYAENEATMSEDLQVLKQIYVRNETRRAIVSVGTQMWAFGGGLGNLGASFGNYWPGARGGWGGQASGFPASSFGYPSMYGNGNGLGGMGGYLRGGAMGMYNSIMQTNMAPLLTHAAEPAQAMHALDEVQKIYRDVIEFESTKKLPAPRTAEPTAAPVAPIERVAPPKPSHLQTSNIHPASLMPMDLESVTPPLRPIVYQPTVAAAPSSPPPASDQNLTNVLLGALLGVACMALMLHFRRV